VKVAAARSNSRPIRVAVGLGDGLASEARARVVGDCSGLGQIVRIVRDARVIGSSRRRASASASKKKKFLDERGLHPIDAMRLFNLDGLAQSNVIFAPATAPKESSRPNSHGPLIARHRGEEDFN